MSSATAEGSVSTSHVGIYLGQVHPIDIGLHSGITRYIALSVHAERSSISPVNASAASHSSFSEKWMYGVNDPHFARAALKAITDISLCRRVEWTERSQERS